MVKIRPRSRRMRETAGDHAVTGARRAKPRHLAVSFASDEDEDDGLYGTDTHLSRC